MNISPELYISPEIIGAIIGVIGGALVTGIISGIGFYLKTRRGNKVVLSKIRETSLLNISNLISDNLSIRYKDKPVGKLKLYEYELLNDGYINIKNLELLLQIEANEKAGLLEVLVDDAQGKTVVENVSNGEYYYLIKRPFLNNKRGFEEEKILVQIFSDSELKINITGSELGWSAVYKEKSVTKLSVLNPILALIMAILFWLMFLSKYLDLDMDLLIYSLISISIIFFISSFYDYFRKKRNKS